MNADTGRERGEKLGVSWGVFGREEKETEVKEKEKEKKGYSIRLHYQAGGLDRLKKNSVSSVGTKRMGHKKWKNSKRTRSEGGRLQGEMARKEKRLSRERE